MARIIEVIGLVNKGEYGLVSVVTDDGTEAEVWIGGDVELYHDPRFDKVKAFIKRPTKPEAHK